MTRINIFVIFVLLALLVGCSSQTAPPESSLDPHALVQQENTAFLQQTAFDPWILTSVDPNCQISGYLPSGATGSVYGPSGFATQVFQGGQYDSNGVIVFQNPSAPNAAPSATEYKQTLDLQHGTLATVSETSSNIARSTIDWQTFWTNSDIVISGDPEAQQVTHAGLFYLCGSALSGSDHSVPPMGLSSNVYNGHIFWDAEIWMLPALLPQHPDLAKSIVDYRFKRLPAAEKLAKSHGFAGAEYPWESAATGLEQAPEEFSHERHITADVAYAAWQYYLWSGDRSYLSSQGWPVLSATAAYWTSRVSLGPDHKYHIDHVVGPDETAGQVSDDAWTNAIVQFNLKAAAAAAQVTGHSADPKWTAIADNISIPYDAKEELYLQYPTMDRQHQQAKQADTTMLIYPLNVPMSVTAAGNTLDYYLKHTIVFGPAMTSSINAIVASRLGRTQQSLDLYHDSYRPFMRGPWDAFSEKRTKSDVYFTTGIGGNLQVVLYGFAGLNIATGGQKGTGTLVAKTGDAALYADPHLPTGWTELTLKGVKFRGATYTIDITSGNVVAVK